MAGFYDDVPGPRMAWDEDGTALRFTASDPNWLTNPSVVAQADMVKLNNEDMTDGWGSTGFGGNSRGLILLFPELRDIDGVFIVIQRYDSSPGANPLEYSADTTNGIDGTWTTAVAAGSWHYTANNTKVPFRSNIVDLALTGVKSIRFAHDPDDNTNPTYRNVHVYGDISASDRLAVWDPSTDTALGAAALDWGDVYQGTNETRTFRIKNRSTSLTASNITVHLEALTDTTPVVVDWHGLSTDGTNFSNSVNIGNLAPGAISSTLHVKRTTPNDAFLGLWWVRIQASAASWA